MATIDFGYTISKPRAIDLDRNNLRKSDEILREMPELQACIGCGSCTATCTAGQFAPFSLRKVQHWIRRGEYETAKNALKACMLCGKCRMVCPRGVNTRAVVHTLLETL